MAVLASLAGGQLAAQEEMVSATGDGYSSVRPIEAINLNNPLRFKPIFGLELGFISLTRETPDPFQFVSDENGNSLLDMNQMQGDVGAGLDSVVNFYNLFSDSNALDVHMRFFQAADMEFDEYLGANQVIPLFYGGVPANPVHAKHVEYDTTVRSFEANLAYRLPLRLRFLTGFRFFEIEERLDVTHTTGNSTLGFYSSTQDMMYGGQIGLEAVPLSGRYGQIVGGVKWAFLSNFIDGVATADDASGNPLSTQIRDTVGSDLLDLQLGGLLYVSRSVSVYAGYQGIIANDVALSPLQLENASIFTPTNAPTLSDTSFHGFNMRLVGTW